MDEKYVAELNMKGLSPEEAAALEKEGKANVVPDKTSQSVASIIFENNLYYSVLPSKSEKLILSSSITIGRLITL